MTAAVPAMATCVHKLGFALAGGAGAAGENAMGWNDDDDDDDSGEK